MLMTCPKCGTVNGSARECVFCGVLFDKIRSDSSRPAVAVVENRSSVRIVIDFFDAIEARLSDWKRHAYRKIGIDLDAVAKSVHRTVSFWFLGVLDALMTILVCGAVAWTVCVILLSAADGMWHLYLETQVGKQFLVQFPERVLMISRLITYQPIVFSFSICLVAAQACLAVAAIARVSFVARGFYENRPALYKIVLWTPACAAAAAWLFQDEYDLSFQLGLPLALLPALFLFQPCFELAARCLPEGNLLWVYRQTSRLIQWIRWKTVYYISLRNPEDDH